MPNPDPAEFQSTKKKSKLEVAGSLGIHKNLIPGVKTRRVALLACDGVDGGALSALRKSIEDAGAIPHVISNRAGRLKTDKGETVKVDGSIDGSPSVLYDGVAIVGGKKSVVTLEKIGAAVRYIQGATKRSAPRVKRRPSSSSRSSLRPKE